MPGPNPNLGGAPHDSDDIQDLWYALQEVGFSDGVLVQADEGFINDESVSAHEETSILMTAPGGDQINGQAQSTGQYSLDVEWLDDNLEVVRREGIISNRESDEWSNYALAPKSPNVRIVIVNREDTEQTISMTGHYR